MGMRAKMKKLKFSYGGNLLKNRAIVDEINDFNGDVKTFTSIFDKWRQGVYTFQGSVLYNPKESEFVMNSSDDASRHYIKLRNRYRAIESDFKMLPEEWQRTTMDELVEARMSMEHLNQAIQQPITAGAVARKTKRSKPTILDRAKNASGVKI